VSCLPLDRAPTACAAGARRRRRRQMFIGFPGDSAAHSIQARQAGAWCKGALWHRRVLHRRRRQHYHLTGPAEFRFVKAHGAGAWRRSAFRHQSLGNVLNTCHESSPGWRQARACPWAPLRPPSAAATPRVYQLIRKLVEDTPLQLTKLAPGAGAPSGTAASSIGGGDTAKLYHIIRNELRNTPLQLTKLAPGAGPTPGTAASSIGGGNTAKSSPAH